MKVPSLLLLLAVAAPAAPAFADGSAHRCDVDWLKAAQSTGLGVAINDPGKYLTAAAGQAPTIDILNPSKLCDATVWRSLAVLAPVGEPILDPKTRQPIGGVTLKWNDPAVQQEWAKGLSAQLKILLDADARYQSIDKTGRDALTAAEAVVSAAEKTGVAARQEVAGPAALKKDGLTGDAYVADKGYVVSALADAPAGTTQDPAELKAAFLQVLDDDNPPAPPKPRRLSPGPPRRPLRPRPRSTRRAPPSPPSARPSSRSPTRRAPPPRPLSPTPTTRPP